MYSEKLKEQRRAASRRWAAKNKEKRQEYYKEYDSQRSVADKLIRSAKDRATKEGIAFSITTEHFDVPSNCPICDVEMRVATGIRGGASYSPTLDKRIPHLGYVPGNVAVICKKCNSLKGDATSEHLRKIADWIENNA